MNDVELIVEAIESLDFALRVGVVTIIVLIVVHGIAVIVNINDVEKAVDRLRRFIK